MSNKNLVRAGLTGAAIAFVIGFVVTVLRATSHSGVGDAINNLFLIVALTFLGSWLLLALFNVAADRVDRRFHTGRFRAGFSGRRRRRLELLPPLEVEEAWQKLAAVGLPGRPIRGWRSLDHDAVVILECAAAQRLPYEVAVGPPSTPTSLWCAGIFMRRRTDLDGGRRSIWMPSIFRRLGHRVRPASASELLTLWSDIASPDEVLNLEGERCARCGDIRIIVPTDDGTRCELGRVDNTSSFSERFLGLVIMHWEPESTTAATRSGAPIS